MVGVTALSGGAWYCIDRTEVTNAQYAAFLSGAAVDASAQPSECSWNASFDPSQGWPATGKDDHPVVYVDWCDAHAYCAWSGKRLCGKIGGGSNPTSAGASAAASQWYNACSNHGLLTYPYGDSWTGLCNDWWHGVLATTAVASLASCAGGVPELYDMCGNVWEWEDSCSAASGAADVCLARGAGFDIKPTNTLKCAYAGTTPARSSQLANVGFRCCMD